MSAQQCNQLEQAVAARLDAWRPFTRLWVAFSGGVDSTALLACVTQAQEPVTALHINHGLQAQSASWESHCRQVAEELGAEFRAVSVAVDLSAAKGTEHAARDARYTTFEQVLGDNDLLLTAHQNEDQAETVLINLLRGAGPRGLAGIPELRSCGAGRIGRPLLDQRRERLAEYVAQRGLTALIDPANRQLDIPRSYLRHQILPRLKEHWPGAVTGISRSALLCAESDASIERHSKIVLQQLIDAEDRLSLDGLLEQPAAMQAAVVRSWIREQQLPTPQRRQLSQVLQQLTARADAQVLVSWPGCEIRRFRSHLYALPPPLMIPSGWQAQWHGPELELPAKLGRLRWRDPSDGPILMVKFRTGGEQLKPLNSSHHRPLKHLFQEAHIPPWQRSRIPLLYYQGRLVSVGTLWRTSTFDRLLRGQGQQIIWHRS